jgi:hypothetical protein
MRKALIVGIDHYASQRSLTGCIHDARAMYDVLRHHEDGTNNFVTPNLKTASSPGSAFDKDDLKSAVRQLFEGDSEIALFYFAGHGFLMDTGGFLAASDTRAGDDGLSLGELMTIANNSNARNKIIILDSCHSGAAGNRVDFGAKAEINLGTTILAASTAEQYAKEVAGGGAGLFTNLLIDALNGAAANLVGEVTPGSVYSHIDQSLGPWMQRPVFKTHVKAFVSLRKTTPHIPLADLRNLAKYFPEPGFKFRLDPAFEPERAKDDPALPPPDPQKNAIFAVLQRYARVNLVRPNGAPHMWHAAMQSESCELTALGEHYRTLVAKELI